jgi:hypothetical protein
MSTQLQPTATERKGRVAHIEFSMDLGGRPRVIKDIAIPSIVQLEQRTRKTLWSKRS